MEGNPLPDRVPAELDPKAYVDLPRLSRENASKYEEIFVKVAGGPRELMSPGKAHAVLLKSKLPKLTLAHVWKLADHNKFVVLRFLFVRYWFLFVNRSFIIFARITDYSFSRIGMIVYAVHLL